MRSSSAVVSVIIVTRDRPVSLHNCLLALVNQSVKPGEVIVVNNSVGQDPDKVISKFKKKLPLRTIYVRERNFPRLYNKGALESRSQIIAFLDDDCVPREDWILNIIMAQTRRPESVIQGKVISVPMNNLYVLIMSQHYKNWLKANSLGGNSLSVIDTKNVSFPRTILLNNLFNESLFLGSHDIELGRRLSEKGALILYAPDIIVFHHERSSLKEFLLQHWRIARSEAFLDWNFPKAKSGMLLNKKNILSISWVIRYMVRRVGIPLEVLRLVVAYTLLVFIRVFGYTYENCILLKNRSTQ